MHTRCITVIPNPYHLIGNMHITIIQIVAVIIIIVIIIIQINIDSLMSHQQTKTIIQIRTKVEIVKVDIQISKYQTRPNLYVLSYHCQTVLYAVIAFKKRSRADQETFGGMVTAEQVG